MQRRQITLISNYLGHSSGFVVTSHQLHTIWVPQLEAGQQRYCLYAVKASIDIVSQEQVVGIRAVASNAKDLNQVVVLPTVLSVSMSCRFSSRMAANRMLPVNVSYDRYRRTDVHDVAFRHEQLFCPLANLLQDAFRQQLLLVESFETRIEVEGHHSEVEDIVCTREKWLKEGEKRGSVKRKKTKRFYLHPDDLQCCCM